MVIILLFLVFVISCQTDKINLENTPQIQNTSSDMVMLYRNNQTWQNIYSRILYAKINNQSVEYKNEYDNLYYANELQPKNFMILDSNNKIGAVSVISYCVLTKTYVLFVDNKSVDGILNFLENKNINNLIIYGKVDSEVLNKLLNYHLQRIDFGNDVENNIQVTKEYLQIKNSTTMILTTGKFLEQSIFSGEDPVLIVNEKYINHTIEFILQNDITTLILIEDFFNDSQNMSKIVQNGELTDYATDIINNNPTTKLSSIIKNRTGVGIFVKFSNQLPNGTIEKLNTFYLV